MTSFVFCVPEDSRNWDATHDPPLFRSTSRGPATAGTGPSDRQASQGAAERGAPFASRRASGPSNSTLQTQQPQIDRPEARPSAPGASEHQRRRRGIKATLPYPPYPPSSSTLLPPQTRPKPTPKNIPIPLHLALQLPLLRHLLALPPLPILPLRVPLPADNTLPLLGGFCPRDGHDVEFLRVLADVQLLADAAELLALGGGG